MVVLKVPQLFIQDPTPNRISEVILKSFKVFSSSAFYSKNLDLGGTYES